MLLPSWPNDSTYLLRAYKKGTAFPLPCVSDYTQLFFRNIPASTHANLPHNRPVYVLGMHFKCTDSFASKGWLLVLL